MKKKMVLIVINSVLAIAVLLAFSICEPFSLLSQKNVTGVTVTSLPEGYNYSFTGSDADAIVEYLSSIKLIFEFEDNPDEYVGMVWVVSIEYENGEAATAYHFGNRFIRVNNGPWYKMTFDEANRFESLLEQLGSST